MKLKPLIKYIGSKHKFAREIISYFPIHRRYFEPFLGSGAVLGHLHPDAAVASDINGPLIDLWNLVKTTPMALYESYRLHLENYHERDRTAYYEKVRDAFNANPNPHDFLFVSRACWGGVIRFRRDGYLSTPVGAHRPIQADAFLDRIRQWHEVVANTEFHHGDFAEIVMSASENDLIYCDPPYCDTQKIIYGAHDFTFERLCASLLSAKQRGARVVLSIDGTKKSGSKQIAIDIPNGLFETEVSIALGGSMLKRFSRDGLDVEDEHVTDRLLLSFEPDHLGPTIEFERKDTHYA